jgi:F0F1-type ATP synthase delta subunit
MEEKHLEPLAYSLFERIAVGTEQRKEIYELLKNMTFSYNDKIISIPKKIYELGKDQDGTLTLSLRRLIKNDRLQYLNDLTLKQKKAYDKEKKEKAIYSSDFLIKSITLDQKLVEAMEYSTLDYSLLVKIEEKEKDDEGDTIATRVPLIICPSIDKKLIERWEDEMTTFSKKDTFYPRYRRSNR